MPIISRLPQGGGGGTKLNIFTQLIEPEEKNGIWLETSVNHREVVIDSKYYIADSWIDPDLGLTEDIPYSFINGSAVNVGSDIHMLGGSGNSKYHYKYDTITDTYTKLADIPYAFSRGSAVNVGGDIHMLGGVIRGNSQYRYKYVPITDTYTKLADIPYEFSSGSAVAIGSDVHMLGGSGKYHYKYDTITDTYTKLADIPYSFSNGSAVAIGSDIYMLGAMGDDWYTKNCRYTFIAKQYAENTIVLDRNSNTFGSYYTELLTPKNRPDGLDGDFDMFQTGFNDVLLFYDSDLKQPPAYYGNGTEWVKFKEGL